MHRGTFLFCVWGVVFLSTQLASADVVGIAGNVQLKLGWWNPATASDQFWTTINITPDSASGAFADRGQWANSWCEINWDVNGNIDPVINGAVAVTNNSGGTQTFVLSFLLPLGAPVLPSSMTSGVVNVTVVDNSGDGATMAAVPGDSLYRSLIDAVSFQTLMNDPTSIVAAAYDTANASASFGLPGQTMPGPAALTTIGLTYRFTLTPNGDAATVNGNFVVLVPEPSGTAALLALALFSLRRRRV